MKLGDLTLSRFKELLSKCDYIRKCRNCPFQDIDCWVTGKETKEKYLDLDKLDLEQELNEDLIKRVESGIYE